MVDKTLAIKIPTPIKQVWWANQPYPSFEALIVDPEGTYDTAAISGWKVAVALVDQNNRWFPLFEYPVNGGKAVISGIRFPLSKHKSEAVCRLAICLSAPQSAASSVQRCVTDVIRIVSMDCVSPAPPARPHQPAALPRVVVPQRQEASGMAVDAERALRALPLALRFTDPVETLWYADRHYPRFEVEIYRTDTNETVTQATGWRVGLTVVDGNGNESLEVVHDHERFLSHPHVFRDGRVSIGGVRFSRVSSKCGGFFRLVVAIVKPGPFLMVASDKIQILSYRLYHAPKVPLEKLGPDDSLAKMKGIGSLYAKRFAALGTGTVGQLASLNLDAMTEMQRSQLLDSLRKERGGLTIAKLQVYIDQARDIVMRHGSPELVQQHALPPALPQQPQLMRVPVLEVSESIRPNRYAPNTPPSRPRNAARRGSLTSRCSNSPPHSPVRSDGSEPREEPAAPKYLPSPRSRSLKRALSNELGTLEEELFGGEEGLFAAVDSKRLKPTLAAPPAVAAPRE